MHKSDKYCYTATPLPPLAEFVTVSSVSIMGRIIWLVGTGQGDSKSRCWHVCISSKLGMVW